MTEECQHLWYSSVIYWHKGYPPKLDWCVKCGKDAYDKAKAL